MQFEGFEKEVKKKDWTDIVTAVSAVLATVTSILSLFVIKKGEEGNVPEWFYWVPVSIVALLIASLAIRWIKSRFPTWKANSIAKKRSVLLLKHAKELNAVTDRSQTLSIYPILTALSAEETWRGKDLASPLFFELFENMVHSLITRLEGGNRNLFELQRGTSELSNLVYCFTQTYYNRAFGTIREIGVTNLKAEQKRNIDTAREHFVAFLREYVGYTKDNMEIFGRGFPGRYLDIPGIL